MQEITSRTARRPSVTGAQDGTDATHTHHESDKLTGVNTDVNAFTLTMHFMELI